MEGLELHKVVKFRKEVAEVCWSMGEDGMKGDKCVKNCPVQMC